MSYVQAAELRLLLALIIMLQARRLPAPPGAGMEARLDLRRSRDIS